MSTVRHRVVDLWTAQDRDEIFNLLSSGPFLRGITRVLSSTTCCTMTTSLNTSLLVCLVWIVETDFCQEICAFRIFNELIENCKIYLEIFENL